MIEFERKGRSKRLTKQEAQRRMDEGSEKGWLYLIEDAAQNAIKVGWSVDPERRMKHLQCGHPGKLRLIAVIPGTRLTEHRIHCRLAHVRRSGEWFARVATLEFLEPIIRDFGLKLVPRANSSRTIPDKRGKRGAQRPELVVEL